MNQQQQQPPQQQQPQQQQQQQQQPSSQPQINDDQKRSNEQTDEDDGQSNEGFVVKMRGLPWSATADDIIKFLSILGEAKVKDGTAGVHLTMAREGRPSGEAYVEMESEEDLKAALKKDREHMGNRYIEVFRSKRSEMEWVIKKTGSTLDSVLDDNCVRLRGLPFGSTKDDIVQFFQGLEMTSDGITIATDFTGRSTGEAFVQFVDRENAEKALQKHKEKIGHRYIEIFRSSLAEIRNQALQRRPRQTPYDRMDRFASSGGSGGSGRYFDMPMRTGRNMKSFGNNGYDNGGDPWSSGRSMGGPRGGGGGQGMMGSSSGGGGGGGWNSNNWNAPPSRPLYVVHMRGLPFKANEDDIATFFEPLEPVDIRILFNNNNRPSGEANVEFGNKEDAMRAMSKDKTYMQHRYIELFMDGPVGGGPGSGGNNFSMDDMGPPNSGNGGNFGGFGNNSFGGNSSGGGGGNSFGNNSFSRRNDNSGPPNSFFSNNMGGGGYPRPSGPRNMSGPGPKFNPF
ncbi:heterogeneous nuclear ribonucleoprotein F-like [Aphis gossypii]|uniref:RRM domain-containing protein n=1 Tax=Aphis gossypii TaxID=80765 RepID=A0A9P0NFH2_APHGO|nr:heterogeneous nuclear ribonucleoprotein F-like [Aphis gossypii]CAH1724269.1 unnamed protein product [Aphis gossypii]